MKYMGSKRAMLQNGLGHLLIKEARGARRFVDLFCGSATVSWFMAENTRCEVIACDLQSYSIALANAVIGRTEILNIDWLERAWLAPAQQSYERSVRRRQLELRDLIHIRTSRQVRALREVCTQPTRGAILWSAYGGHYFSGDQAIKLDLLLNKLPPNPKYQDACKAALIIASMRCTAAPGHTAQPFQPTTSALGSILEAWAREPFSEIRRALTDLADRKAHKKGKAFVADAADAAKKLNRHDLVFVDPPYSGVQYSRFYHVLETVALGESGEVSGVGRYPALPYRPQSAYSNKTESLEALRELFGSLAAVGAKTIMTFPEGDCSNGLSGQTVIAEAKKLFDVAPLLVESRFSTMGGNNRGRAARKHNRELILLLKP